MGATIDLSHCAAGVSPCGLLFGEDGARAVLSADPSGVESLLALARHHEVPLCRAGAVAALGGQLRVQLGEQELSWSIVALRETYFGAIPRRMQQADASRSNGA
jgi:hypothetical protein